MIAFLSAKEMGSWDTSDYTPVSRVRNQMKVNRSRRELADSDPRLRADLKTLLSRLARLRGRGGAFAGVELAPELQETVGSLKIVGNEMLSVFPERRGA